MKCRGKHEIFREVSRFPRHFMLYRGKSISFGTVQGEKLYFFSFLKYLFNYGFLVFSSSWINTLYVDWLCPQCKAYGRAKQKIKQMKRTSREYKVIVRILRGNVVYLFKYLLQGTGF